MSQLEAEECLGPLEADRGEEPLLEASGGWWGCHHSDFRLPASETGTAGISAVLSLRVRGTVTATLRNQYAMGPGSPTPLATPPPLWCHISPYSPPLGEAATCEHLLSPPSLIPQPGQKPPFGLFKEAHGHGCIIPLPHF